MHQPVWDDLDSSVEPYLFCVFGIIYECIKCVTEQQETPQSKNTSTVHLTIDIRLHGRG